MEAFVQFSAKTKSDAITKACIELGTSSDQLEIEVVSEGSSGFFGIGARPAVIKARKKVSFTEEDEIKDIIGNVSLEAIRKDSARKENRKPEKKKQAPKEKPAVKEQKQKEAKKETPKEEEKKQEAPEKKEETKAKKEAPAPVEEAKVTEEKEAAERPETEKPAGKERSSRSRRDRSRKKQNRQEKTNEAAADKAEAPQKEEKEKPVKVSKPIEPLTDEEEIRDVEERAAGFLRSVFDSMDMQDIKITSQYNKEEGCLDVVFEGEDMGTFIGKRGQTLDSLQYLTSLVVNKGKDKYVRVKLDTEDYRRRRKETLENLARGIAYKVKKTRKPVVLEPMNPYERRIIHSSLQGNKFVETISEGEEPYRHIVVKLKKN